MNVKVTRLTQNSVDDLAQSPARLSLPAFSNHNFDLRLDYLFDQAERLEPRVGVTVYLDCDINYN